MKKGHKKEIKKIFSTLIAVIIMAAMGFLQLMSDAHIVYAQNLYDDRDRTGGKNIGTKDNENYGASHAAWAYGTGANVVVPSLPMKSGIYQFLNNCWSTDSMPEFALEKLYRADGQKMKPYIDLFKENFVWATANRDLDFEGGHGFYYDAQNKLRNNAYAFSSFGFGDTGGTAAAPKYVFSPVVAGSRYLITTAFELQYGGGEYVFSPLFVLGNGPKGTAEGGDVDTKIYMAVQGFSGTATNQASIHSAYADKMYNAQTAVYRMTSDGVTWMDKDGKDANHVAVPHYVYSSSTFLAKGYTPLNSEYAKLRANIMKYDSQCDTKYVVIILRYQSGDTTNGTGGESVIYNSKIVPSQKYLALPETTPRIDLGSFAKAYICYKPFKYTFTGTVPGVGAKNVDVTRSGVETVNIPSAFPDVAGYTKYITLTSAANTVGMSASAISNLAIKPDSSSKMLASEWATILKGGKYYEALFGDVTLTVTYEPIDYSISYNLNGGTVSGTNPTSYNVTTPTFALINPTKTGYDFTGWTGTGLGGATTSVSVVKGSTGNRAYTANWSAKSFTNSLIYNANGGTGAPATQTASVTYPSTSSTFTLSTTKPTKTGYTFAGWYDAASGGNAIGATTTVGSASYAGNQSKTVYAHWTANTYNIVYDLNGGTAKAGGSYPSKATYDTAFGVSVPTKAGYVFAGWNVSSGLNTTTAKYGTTAAGCTSALNAATLKIINGANDSSRF